MMQISVVIPLYNEEASIHELHEWILRVMTEHQFTFEIIFVNDGSKDHSEKILNQLAQQYENVHVIHFFKNYGKSQALHAGFKIASGEVVITMDADLQDNPEEIPELYQMIVEEKFDLVSGWKKVRHDAILTKNIPSKLFNKVASWTSGIKLHDFNCGLKAYKKEVVKSIDVKGEMHRYIPILAKNEGFDKIGEKVVKHQARKYGTTKFGAERFLHGFLDLISVWFFTKFGKRPMHFFGALGGLMFIIGFFASAWIGISKIYKLWNNQPAILVTNNPWFYIALTAMIIGVLLFIAGFLGELILNNNQHTQRYQIKNSTKQSEKN